MNPPHRSLKTSKIHGSVDDGNPDQATTPINGHAHRTPRDLVPKRTLLRRVRIVFSVTIGVSGPFLPESMTTSRSIGGGPTASGGSGQSRPRLLSAPTREQIEVF